MYSSDTFELLLFVGFLAFIVISNFYMSYKRRRRSVDTPGSSVLLTYYTDGSSVLPLASGKLGDMHYTAFLAGQSQVIAGGYSQPALLYRVELPYASNTHLVGIPKGKNAEQLDPSQGKSLLEKVTLEGNYEKYFTLFAAKGMGSDTQYVLDPKAMVFTIDFCQSHSWEIVDNELYFAQTTSNIPEDPTLMADDVVQFVKEIEPAIAKPLTSKQIHQRTPYHEERRTNLRCPICNQVLTNQTFYLSCPKNDGVLVKGSSLLSHVEGKRQIPDLPNSIVVPEREKQLQCPSCSQIMQHVRYNGGSTIIDSCINCPYRWLDNDEVSRVTKRTG